jgi:hypothetical protein
MVVKEGRGRCEKAPLMIVEEGKREVREKTTDPGCGCEEVAAKSAPGSLMVVERRKERGARKDH